VVTGREDGNESPRVGGRETVDDTPGAIEQL
jgi:hypothetical protein